MFLGIDKIAGDRLAAIDDQGGQITYGDLVTATSHLFGVLPKRSIVFLMCRNTVGALAAYISMVENDIVPVMLSEAINSELFRSLLDTYKPQFICANTSFGETTSFVSVFEEKGFSYYATGNPIYPIHRELQLLMTTSGSTGSPKLVRYKKGNLESNAKNVAIAWEWTEKERPICDLQMNYTMGLNVINTHLYVGATLLLLTRNITDSGYWRFIKEQRATNFTGVPFSYDILWKLRFNRMDLPDLTTLSEGGGKLTDQMFQKVAEYARETGKRFIASFGTTETAARLAMLAPEMALEKIGSIGKAIPEGKILLLDEDGNEVLESSTEGELAYRGPNVTMGYAMMPADLMKGDEFCGLYKTGDMARKDQDGFYYIIGRKSRFLKILGYRVSLDQCERLLHDAFGVECACSGSDDRMDIYVTVGGMEDEIKHYICEKTGIYSSKFKVIHVAEIPRNAAGKILYNALNT